MIVKLDVTKKKKGERIKIIKKYWYSFLYPRIKIDLDKKQYQTIIKSSILLYQPINTNIMRYYSTIYKLKKLNKKVLSISNISSFIESFCLYHNNNDVQINKNDFYFFHVSYLNENSQIYNEMSKKIKSELLKQYPINYIEKNTQITTPENLNKHKSGDKYDIIQLDILSFYYSRLKLAQLLFSGVLLSLIKLKKEGTLLYYFPLVNDNLQFHKEIIAFLTQCFENHKYHFVKITGELMCVILTNYNGIKKDNLKKLINIHNKWYKIDKSGGKCLEFIDEKLKNCKTKSHLFYKALFDIKNKKYDAEFNKIVLTKRNKIIYENDYLVEKYNFNNVDEYISNNFYRLLATNINYAKKLNLAIKPEFKKVKYDYEKSVFSQIYIVNRISVGTIIKYDDQVSFNIDALDYKKYNYRFEELDIIKNKLNKYKFAIDNRDNDKWFKVSRSINMPLYIKYYISNNYNIKNVTRAFIKLYELLYHFRFFDNLNEVTSLHICEAPGNFISATNYYIQTQTNIKKWNWKGNSLNPYNKKNIQKYPKLIKDIYGYIEKYKQKWLWGKDGTGDITKKDNLLHIINNNYDKNDFMTSDCGLDSSEFYNMQEAKLSILNLAQSIIALTTVKKNGNAVLKVFLPLSESISVSIIFLLYNHFDKINIVKQSSGSPGSSEVYLVCQNLLHHPDKQLFNYLLDVIDNYDYNLALFPKSVFPTSFIKQLAYWSQYLVNKQINFLKKSFYYYDNPSILAKHMKKIKKYKYKRAKYWAKKHNIVNINKNKLL